MKNAKWFLIAAVVATAAGTAATTAQAQHYNPYSSGSAPYSSGYNPSGPAYHQPSVHVDRVYHAETRHWTPFRGLHTHGHYDSVPHYTPGHFDKLHGGHVDPNPNYHHR